MVKIEDMGDLKDKIASFEISSWAPPAEPAPKPAPKSSGPKQKPRCVADWDKFIA